MINLDKLELNFDLFLIENDQDLGNKLPSDIKVYSKSSVSITFDHSTLDEKFNKYLLLRRKDNSKFRFVDEEGYQEEKTEFLTKFNYDKSLFLREKEE